MSDLINRQDAIDIICKASCPKVDIEQCSKEPTVCLEIAALKNLPSAEPNDKLKKITDLVDGTIDHFDLDDAMDLLYQIKDVCEKQMR